MAGISSHRPSSRLRMPASLPTSFQKWPPLLLLWLWSQRFVLAEIGLYIVCYLVYLLTRGLAHADTRAVGIVNGERVAALQDELGFLWEPGWQAWALEHIHGVVVFLNWAYIITYWPVILALAVVLFVTNRRRYYFYRSVVLVDLAAALLVFTLFPVASPFAIPTVQLLDTIQAFGPTFYGAPEMAAYYNISAAMPSLHFSWTLILGVFCWRTLPGGLKAVGVLYPVLTFFAIVLTGNHFILDAIVGGVVAGLAFGAVELVKKVRLQRVRPTLFFIRSTFSLRERGKGARAFSRRS